MVEKLSAVLTPSDENLTYEEQIPVDATHQDICRFASRDDDTYKTAVQSIMRLFHSDKYANITPEYYIVPRTANTHFTGRKDVLDRLSECLVFGRHADHQQLFVLYGLGGSGKTQICMKFAQDHRDR